MTVMTAPSCVPLERYMVEALSHSNRNGDEATVTRKSIPLEEKLQAAKINR
jgi:hypothetical protein